MRSAQLPAVIAEHLRRQQGFDRGIVEDLNTRIGLLIVVRECWESRRLVRLVVVAATGNPLRHAQALSAAPHPAVDSALAPLHGRFRSP